MSVRVDRIRTLACFDAERKSWEAIERVDSGATTFTSWRWLRAYLPVSQRRWFILALREDGRTVGYLPLAESGPWFDRELYLAGDPVADYTGMVALPSHERRAINAFADAIRDEAWATMHFRNAADPRIGLLVQRLQATQPRLRLESIDETVCRSVQLLPSWEQFCAEKLGAGARRRIRRSERALHEAVPNLRFGQATGADVETYIEALLFLREQRWGGGMRFTRRRFAGVLRRAFDLDAAWIFVYWDGARPIAAAGLFLDAPRGTVCGYLTAYDAEYHKLSPGISIIAQSLKHAILAGYQRFDFLQGDEDYKMHFAPDVTRTWSYRVALEGRRYERARLLLRYVTNAGRRVTQLAEEIAR